MTPSPAASKPTSPVKTPTSAVFNDEIYRVPENINFSEEEEKTLKYWSEIKVFEQCLQQSKGKPK